MLFAVKEWFECDKLIKVDTERIKSVRKDIMELEKLSKKMEKIDNILIAYKKKEVAD